MSAEALCKRVTEFGFKLLEHEFALDARQHTVARRSGSTKDLIWARNADQALIISNPWRVADYLSLIERLEYSYLMRDGGLIQIAYVVNSKKIEKHRLGNVDKPSPHAQASQQDKAQETRFGLVEACGDAAHFLQMADTVFDARP